MNKPRIIERPWEPLVWWWFGYTSYQMHGWWRWAFPLIFITGATATRLVEWWQTPVEVYKPERPF
jgi:hypothetical protein